MRSPRPLVVGILGLILLSQLVLVAAWIDTNRSARLSAPPVDEEPFVGSPDQPATLESAFRVAADRARAWSPESVLIHASIQLDWPLDPVPPGPPELPGGGWVTFIFYSPDVDGQAATLSLLIERYYHAIRMEEVLPWRSFAPETPSVPVLSVPVDSVLALVTTEIGLGQAFRQECPELRHQTRVTLDLVVADEAIEEPELVSAATAVGTPVALATPIVLGTPAATPVNHDDALDQSVNERARAAPPGYAAIWTISYQDRGQPDRVALRVRVDAQSGEVIEIRDRRSGC